MNIRVRFSKYGFLKFIGHLDVMRYFQKAIRRADIDILYSEGYSPHQIMSFASPLGLGITSEGEYMDIAVGQTDSSVESIRRLNAQMAEGIEILSYRQLPEKSTNAMASVAAADYVVDFREEYRPEGDWQQDFLAAILPFSMRKRQRRAAEKSICGHIYTDCQSKMARSYYD